MTFDHQNDGSRNGCVLERAALTGLPLTTDVMNVSGLRTISFGSLFEFGSGTLTRLDAGIEASYDGGQTWMPVSINVDKAAPPNSAMEPGTARKVLGAADENWCYELEVSSFDRVRCVISAGVSWREPKRRGSRP